MSTEKTVEKNEVGEPFKGTDALVKFVEIGKIKPNPHQPRKSFESEPLEELAQSIRKHGVLQPLLVEKISDSEYRIIAGERRYRAANIAKLSTLPVIIREFSNLERMEIAVTENVQRKDLNPIEEAMAYYYLLSEGSLSQEEVSERIGKSRSAIANSVRLLNLPQSMQDALLENKITAGHARALLQTKAPADREALFNLIVNEGLSVRTAESLANEYNNGGRIFHKSKENFAPKSAAIAKQHEELEIEEVDSSMMFDREIVLAIQDKFIRLFGTKVVLSGTFNKGKLVISYNSYQNLEKIFERAGGEMPLVDEED